MYSLVNVLTHQGRFINLQRYVWSNGVLKVHLLFLFSVTIRARKYRTSWLVVCLFIYLSVYLCICGSVYFPSFTHTLSHFLSFSLSLSLCLFFCFIPYFPLRYLSLFTLFFVWWGYKLSISPFFIHSLTHSLSPTFTHYLSHHTLPLALHTTSRTT